MAKISGLDGHLIEQSGNISGLRGWFWARSDSSAITYTRTRTLVALLGFGKMIDLANFP